MKQLTKESPRGKVVGVVLRLRIGIQFPIVLIGLAHRPHTGGEGRTGDRMAPSFMARVTEGMNLPGSETEKTVRGASFGGNLSNLGLHMVGFNDLFHIQVEESSWTHRPGPRRGLGQKRMWEETDKNKGRYADRQEESQEWSPEASLQLWVRDEELAARTERKARGMWHPRSRGKKGSHGRARDDAVQRLATTCLCK